MPVTQHIVTTDQWTALGGWEPAVEQAPGSVVIFASDDTTGEVAWASWAEGDIDPLTRLNPDLPAVDDRSAP